MKIKNLRQAIPNGFLFEQRETGWKSWIASPNSQWDFYLLCMELMAHRQANKARFPWLSTDLGTIQSQVEEVNAQRVAAIPGAESYLDTSAPAIASFPKPPHSPASVAGAEIGKLASGAATILDWLGSGGKPVSKELAEKRAEICVKCPENGDGNLSRVFTVPLANMIKRQLEQRKDFNLTTSQDEKLGICGACLCPMKLKIWLDIQTLISHTPENVFKDFDPRCWILSERDSSAKEEKAVQALVS